MLEAKCLQKAVIPSSLINNPSPGTIQSTRLALHVTQNRHSCFIYIASGPHIYKLQGEPQFDPVTAFGGDWNPLMAELASNSGLLGFVFGFHSLVPRGSPDFGIALGGTSVDKGKESLLIPLPTKIINPSVVKRCPHRSEIQSIVLADAESLGYLLLGSVDSCGHLIVSKLDASGKDIDRLTYSALPPDNGIGEGSWSGLCFSPNQISMAAVARSFCKTVDIFDQDMHIRRLRPLWEPTSITFVQNGVDGDQNSLLAITEGSQLTLWDLRVNENGGCVHRISGTPGDTLYSVCSSSTGNIATAGVDRTVTIYDPRRWSSLSRWVHCSKFEITGLAFSTVDPDYMYIQGVDYEVLCGQWKECTKLFSFRGDSNWLGFSKCSNKDVLGGWCDSGSIFVADVV